MSSIRKLSTRILRPPVSPYDFFSGCIGFIHAKRLIHSGSAVVTLLVSCCAFAASPEEIDLSVSEADSLSVITAGDTVSDNVYRVEVIVLAHKYDNGIDVEERWDFKSELNYPRPLQIIRKNREAELIGAVDGPGTGADASELSLDSASLMTQLGKQQRTLNDMAMQMRLRKGYRLLFHEAWFQQLRSSRSSTPVFIEGGQWFDPYFELSGTVTIALDRYLHVRTSLWLAEFIKRSEVAAVPWHARMSSSIQYNLPTRDQALNRSLPSNSAPLVSESELTLNGEQQAFFEYSQANVANRGSHVAEVVYTLNEARRVNSTEYHYFDHPRFGVIVKLTPLARVFEQD